MKRSTLLAALVVFLAACSTPLVVDRTNLAAEPTSTDDLQGIGGSTHTAETIDAITARSHLAVEAEVVDVHKSRLNTKDGLFPTADDIRRDGDLGEIAVYTEVDLKIISTLAAYDGAELAPGELVTIQVGGGQYETVLDVETATVLNIKEPINEPPGSDDPESDASTIDTSIEDRRELEVTPTEPVDFVWGSSPSVSLSEGDTVVILLSQFDVPAHDPGAAPFRFLGPTHPFGVFSHDEAGRWVSDRAPTETLNVDTLNNVLGADIGRTVSEANGFSFDNGAVTIPLVCGPGSDNPNTQPIQTIPAGYSLTRSLIVGEGDIASKAWNPWNDSYGLDPDVFSEKSPRVFADDAGNGRASIVAVARPYDNGFAFTEFLHCDPDALDKIFPLSGGGS